MSSVAPDPNAITRQGHRRLAAELDRLLAERPRLAADLRQLREDGAGAEVEDGLTTTLAAQALERRIEALRAVLADARVAEPPPAGVAGLGATVTIEMQGASAPVTYELVGAVEADPGARRLSVASPIGSALLGRRAGDVVAVATPGGARSVRVVAVGGPAAA